MKKLGMKANEHISEMVNMMLDFSSIVCVRRLQESIIVSCKLYEGSTKQPCVLYCVSTERDLEELDYSKWETYKTSVDYHFDINFIKKNTPPFLNGDVITGKKDNACFKFVHYVDPVQLRYWIESEMLPF